MYTKQEAISGMLDTKERCVLHNHYDADHATRIRSAVENYNRTQSGLVSEVVNVAASYCPVIEQLAGV
jgi:hypothetical protein